MLEGFGGRREVVSRSVRAARSVVEILAASHPLGAWLVTEIRGDRQAIVAMQSPGFDLGTEASCAFHDTLCARLLRGEGPAVAPAVSHVPAYAEAPITTRLGIGAYIGAPLRLAGDVLLGTVCGIHPQPDPTLPSVQPLLEQLAGVLVELLTAEAQLELERQRAERAEREALVDALTGVANRRGWNRLLQTEEARCQRSGAPACVILIDLDGLKAINDADGHAAGDHVLREAATALVRSSRRPDVVARRGGDEFGVLAVDCDLRQANDLAQRLPSTLERADIAASVGVAQRRPKGSLVDAVRTADLAMYADKGRTP